jgi:hypothetical protein
MTAIAAPAPVIHAVGLTKRFCELEAVKGIDLEMNDSAQVRPFAEALGKAAIPKI